MSDLDSFSENCKIEIEENPPCIPPLRKWENAEMARLLPPFCKGGKGGLTNCWLQEVTAYNIYGEIDNE